MCASSAPVFQHRPWAVGEWVRPALWSVLFLVAALCSLSGRVAAQDSKLNPVERSGVLAPPAPEFSPLDRIPAAIQYLPNAKGELVAVPVDANLEQFLEWLRQQKSVNATAPRIPPYSITAIELDGQADDQWANLRAKLTVQLSATNGAVVCPLGLGEATIRQVEITGPGRAVYLSRERDRGYVWSLEGRGSYEFTLNLSVPLFKVSPWRRLQLTLPTTPVSTLKMAIPFANATVKTPDEVVIASQPLDEQRSELRASGFGNRLDVSWQPTLAVTDRPTGLDVNTSVLVRSFNEAFVLEATQFVRALQGTFREFVVKLPPKSELMQVDGPEISETVRDPQFPDRVTVRLSAATTGPVSVRWTVRVPQTGRRQIDLDGWTVTGGTRQSGEVGLAAVDGFRWHLPNLSDPHLERMNAGEFRSPNGVTVARAFRFFSQPYRLTANLEAVEPYYDVASRFALTAGQDETRLEGRFQIRLFRGQLTELTFMWPGWRTEGWELEGLQPQGKVVTGLSTDDDLGDGRIVVGLAEQLPESFELRLQARRPRRDADEGRLTLPRLSGPAGSATRLVLLRAENVDAEIAARGETLLRPDQVSKDDPWTFAPSLRPDEWRIDTDERALQLTVTPQQLRVSVANDLEGTWSSRRLRMRQTLRHTIEYARLSEFLFAAPATLAERVRISYQGRELPIRWSVNGPQERLAKITLDEPVIGTAEFLAEWEQPLPEAMLGDQAAVVVIPLLQSRNTTLSETRIRIPQSAWFDVTMNDPLWSVERADDEEFVWRTTDTLTQATLQTNPISTSREIRQAVRRAVARVHVDRAGVHHAQFALQLEGWSRQLHVQLPKAIPAAAFAWNGTPLTAEALVEIPAGSRRFTLSLPASPDGEPLGELTIDYRLPGRSAPGWASQQVLAVPVLPHCRWIADIAWEVTMPTDQHLLSYSERLTPLFRWQRTGVVWRRVSPTVNSAAVRPPEGTSLRGQTHAYVFSQFGGLEPVTIRTMNTTAALLAGGGLTVICGFLLIRLPRFLRIVAALCLAMGALAVALWWLPEAELLAQPMALGLLFPLWNGLQSRWRRRRAQPTVVTIPAPSSELHPPNRGDGSVTHSVRVGPQDSATIYRQPVATEAGLRVTAESHVG